MNEEALSALGTVVFLLDAKNRMLDRGKGRKGERAALDHEISEAKAKFLDLAIRAYRAQHH